MLDDENVFAKAQLATEAAMGKFAAGIISTAILAIGGWGLVTLIDNSEQIATIHEQVNSVIGTLQRVEVRQSTVIDELGQVRGALAAGRRA